MTESEFLALADSTLKAIEAGLEQIANESDLDVECSRSGNVLEIEFVDNGSKIIVNSQAPMQEMWVAAKAGGFHYWRVGKRDGRFPWPLDKRARFKFCGKGFNLTCKTFIVPAKAGIYSESALAGGLWVPAFAGKTEGKMKVSSQL